jgi:hypothetical protein
VKVIAYRHMTRRAAFFRFGGVSCVQFRVGHNRAGIQDGSLPMTGYGIKKSVCIAFA